ncbi:hypothetical protein PN473_09425 [Dolichospermum circinale CS-545/17]|nr:hypothetical protein [Dolichospermum circinale CS-545/17]
MLLFLVVRASCPQELYKYCPQELYKYCPQELYKYCPQELYKLNAALASNLSVIYRLR